MGGRRAGMLMEQVVDDLADRAARLDESGLSSWECPLCSKRPGRGCWATVRHRGQVVTVCTTHGCATRVEREELAQRLAL